MHGRKDAQAPREIWFEPHMIRGLSKSSLILLEELDEVDTMDYKGLILVFVEMNELPLISVFS
jgi:hypothetical protein